MMMMNDNNGVEEIHSVGTVNNEKSSYFTQLKYVTSSYKQSRRHVVIR